MKKYLIVLLIFFLTIIGILFYLKLNIETIYNKNLINPNEECYIGYINKKVSCSLIKEILNNKDITWSASINTYATNSFLILTKSNNLSFSFIDKTGYIVLNYKHDWISNGWVQVISDHEFNKLKKKLEYEKAIEEINFKLDKNLKMRIYNKQ